MPCGPREASRRSPSPDFLERVPQPVQRAVWAIQDLLTFQKLSSFLSMGLLLVLAVGAFRVGPFLYRRRALAQEAASLAGTSLNLSEGEIQETIHRKAFTLGFTTVLRQRHAFTVRKSVQENLPMCAISYEFRQPIRIFGKWFWRMRVRGRVERMAVEAPRGGRVPVVEASAEDDLRKDDAGEEP